MVLDERSLDQLRELIGGDEAELRDLIEIFLQESTEMLGDMEQSLRDQDLDLLRRSAHSLKSSSQDFGATQLSELSASLESSCRNRWPDSPERVVGQISENFLLVNNALVQYLTDKRA